MDATRATPPAGPAAFEPEIAALLAADPHRPGSVDAVLLDRLVPLTAATRDGLYPPPEPPAYQPGSRPELERFVRAAAGDALHPLQAAAALTRFCARIPRAFPTPERSTASGFYGGYETYLCGGTEEEVIKKGSPLSLERARALCAMAQIAGLPARIVVLFRLEPAEMHAVTEIGIQGRWNVFDGFSGRFYPQHHHWYANAWEARRNPELVDHHPDHGRDRYVDSAYYRTAGIVAYPVAGFGAFEYPWDPIPPHLAARLKAGLGA